MNVGDLVTFRGPLTIGTTVYANLKDVDYGVVVKFVRIQARPFRNTELSAAELQLLLESCNCNPLLEDNVWNVHCSNGKQCLHYECDLVRYE